MWTQPGSGEAVQPVEGPENAANVASVFDMIRVFGDLLERVKKQPDIQIHREPVTVAPLLGTGVVAALGLSALAYSFFADTRRLWMHANPGTLRGPAASACCAGASHAEAKRRREGPHHS